MSHQLTDSKPHSRRLELCWFPFSQMTFGRRFCERELYHQSGSCSVSHSGSGLLLGVQISMHEDTGAERAALKHVKILLVLLLCRIYLDPASRLLEIASAYSNHKLHLRYSASILLSVRFTLRGSVSIRSYFSEIRCARQEPSQNKRFNVRRYSPSGNYGSKVLHRIWWSRITSFSILYILILKLCSNTAAVLNPRMHKLPGARFLET